MKNKRKQFFFTSLCLSSIAIIGLSVSCSKTQNNQEQNPEDNKPNPQPPVNPDNNQTDEQAVKEYIKTLNPKIKESKKSEKNQTLASTINNEDLIKQWFDGIPETKNEIQVQFVSALADNKNETILIVKFKIEKGNYSEMYNFQEEGFIKPSDQFKFREFSEKNSFKIQFQVSNPLPTTTNYLSVSGTAWSWYYDQKSNGTSNNIYNWYLMTNFHVVDPVVAFTTGHSKVENDQWQYDRVDSLVNYYNQAVLTQYDIHKNKNYFELSTYSDQEQKYQPLIQTNKQQTTNQKPITNNDVVKEVSIITDFNNDSLDLFSKSDTNKNTLYNLDMALVKITMDFNNHLDRIKPEDQRPNVVSKYQSKAEEYQQTKFNPNQTISIGGHPGAENKLITADIKPPFHYVDNLDFNNEPVYQYFKAPYYFAQKPEINFKLSGGASGSAVYQLSNYLQHIPQWDTIIPIAIYWGGYKTEPNIPISKSFIPSVIPLIIDDSGTKITYNIFTNFIATLNQN